MEEFDLNTDPDASPAPPPNHSNRRKSSRRSILPIAFPVESSTESPATRRLSPKSLQDALTQPDTEAASCSTASRSPPSPSPGTEYTDSAAIIERYNKEIDAWHSLVQRFEDKLAHSNSKPNCLPSAQWIQEDRIVSHYRELLLPLCEDSEIHCTIPAGEASCSLENLKYLHRKIMFDLAYLPELLLRQKLLLRSLRQRIKLKWDSERERFEVNHRRVDEIVEDFLSDPP